jgi:hypothetical protein
MKEKEKTLNVKKIILISLSVLAGLIVALVIGLWIFCFVTLSTYRSEKDGVEIAYPKSWEVREHPATDVIVAFVSVKENELDTFNENVNLSTYDMSALSHSTADYAKIMVDQLLMIFTDLKLVEKTPFLVAGHKGYRMVLQITGETAKMIVVYAFTIDTMGYNILYIGSNEAYARDRVALDMMALTFKLKYPTL